MHEWFLAYGKASLCYFTRIMDARFYVTVLEEQLPEAKEMLGNNWRFQQQDNDPNTKNFLQENVPITIDWPSKCPDLNPIENLWAYIKRNIEKRNLIIWKVYGQRMGKNSR